MKEGSDSFYSRREERPSLADEIERDHRTVSGVDGGLRKQLKAMRLRRLWMQRVVITVALLYTMGLTAFIAVIMSHGEKRGASSASRSVVGTAPSQAGSHSIAAVYSIKEIRSLVQKWEKLGDQLHEAHAWMQKGRRDMAGAILQEALKDNPDNGDVLLELAQLAFEQGAFDRSRVLLQRVLNIDPQHKKACQMLADTYSHLGQHEQALVLADWILAGDSEAVEAHRVAGLAHEKAKRLNQAAVHFRKWSALAPDNLEAQKQYAAVLMSLQEFEKAGNLYAAILRKTPNEMDAYRQLAVCYAKQMQVEKTVATMIQALYVVGAPNVTKWFKDPAFDNIRTNKLFVVLERQVAMPAMSGKMTQAGEVQLNLDATFDQKRMQQLQDALKRK